MILGGILCGMIADKWKCHSKVIASVCLVSLVAITTKPVISVYYGNPETNQCPSSIIEGTGNSSEYDNGTLYKIMFLINFCFAFCEGAGLAFVDTSTLRRIDLTSKDRAPSNTAASECSQVWEQ